MLAFQAGDRPAFDALFERYRQPIWSFFRRRTDRTADAEELAQETFLAVIQAARRYEPRSTFRSYLFSIAFNLLSARRRQAKREGASVPIELHDVAAASSDPAASIWVREALAALDPADREMLMLREYDALGYADIAAVVGVPLNTVKSRLFRARLALRDQLRGVTQTTGVRS